MFFGGYKKMETLGLEAIMALIAGMIVFFVVLLVALYIYLGLAFTAIGKKAKLKTPGLAWIPFLGPLIIAYQTSKMHWWPWLLIIGFVIPFLNFLAIIAFTVFAYIWTWKMFEAVKKPGWWALLGLIPFVGGLVLLVMYGVAAWSKD